MTSCRALARMWTRGSANWARVMADETYHQSVVRVPRSGVTRMPNTPPRESRQLISEFTLIHFEEGVSHWLGFRSVRLVDGKGVVVPGPSLADLMKDDRLSWRERWERVRDMNAAFNIGSISRDVNIPTFALAALKMVNQSRFRFSKPQSDTVDGEVLTALDIRETARPTLVSGLRGRDVPLNGTVWLDPREGRVRRTEILLRISCCHHRTSGVNSTRETRSSPRVSPSYSGPTPTLARGCRSRCANATTTPGAR